MRLIDAEPFDFNKVVIPDGGPNFMRGYGLGAKHVCDQIAATSTVEAVPLDKLCDWLAERYEPPYALIDIDKLRRPIDFRQQKEIWMAALTKWMEEEHAAD